MYDIHNILIGVLSALVFVLPGFRQYIDLLFRQRAGGSFIHRVTESPAFYFDYFELIS